MTTPYQKRQIVMKHQNTKRGRLTTVDQKREVVMITSVYQKREVAMRHLFTRRGRLS
jgi:hypothetical protein